MGGGSIAISEHLMLHIEIPSLGDLVESQEVMLNDWFEKQYRDLKEREKQNDYNSISITIRGKTFKSLKAAAKIYGINYKLVSSRLISGWDVDEAFELVARKKKGK